MLNSSTITIAFSIGNLHHADSARGGEMVVVLERILIRDIIYQPFHSDLLWSIAVSWKISFAVSDWPENSTTNNNSLCMPLMPFFVKLLMLRCILFHSSHACVIEPLYVKTHTSSSTSTGSQCQARRKATGFLFQLFCARQFVLSMWLMRADSLMPHKRFSDGHVFGEWTRDAFWGTEYWKTGHLWFLLYFCCVFTHKTLPTILLFLITM